MRKKTLAGLCSLLTFAVLFGLRFAGVRVPFGFGAFVALLVLMPLVVVALTPLNKRLLAWRKARGRDIEEEEKYEREGAGIISIRPKSQAEIEEDERRHLHPSLR
jgi:hypothetical protein